MKIIIELEIDLGNSFFDPKENEEVDWFYNEVLNPKTLYLHSNEIGDLVGEITQVIDARHEL